MITVPSATKNTPPKSALLFLNTALETDIVPVYAKIPPPILLLVVLPPLPTTASLFVIYITAQDRCYIKIPIAPPKAALLFVSLLSDINNSPLKTKIAPPDLSALLYASLLSEMETLPSWLLIASLSELALLFSSAQCDMDKLLLGKGATIASPASVLLFEKLHKTNSHIFREHRHCSTTSKYSSIGIEP